MILLYVNRGAALNINVLGYCNFIVLFWFVVSYTPRYVPGKGYVMRIYTMCIHIEYLHTSNALRITK